MVEENGVRRQVPDNRLFVIDLAATPPKLIDTLAIGRQPSGLSINRAGTLALVANRADNSVSVLRIADRKVTLIDTVAMGESVSHVRSTPDGRRALASKFPNHKVAMLEIEGEKVTYNKLDFAAGPWPYNVDVTPDGKLALTADNGNSGASDGQIDTVERDRPRSQTPTRDRQGGGRRRPRGAGDQPHWRDRGGGPAQRQRRGGERRLVRQP